MVQQTFHDSVFEDTYTFPGFCTGGGGGDVHVAAVMVLAVLPKSFDKKS